MTNKENIIKAYLTLGAERGFDNISLSDIANEVGICKASLFSHFQGFEEIKKAAEDYCRDILENTNFSINFKATSKKQLFQSFLDSYSEAFSTYPLSCYLSLIDQKKAFSEKYQEENRRINMMICSRLTVAIDFSVQHGWSDINDTDRMAWFLTLCLRDNPEESELFFSEL